MSEGLKHLIALGQEQYQKGNYDQAEHYLQQAVAQTDAYADVHNMLGVIYHESGRYVQAQLSFEKALEINPRYTEAALNLAITYNDLGKYDAAKKTYQSALRMGGAQTGKPDDFALGKIANLHADTAHAYADIGLLSEAIEELRKAIRLRPSFVDLRLLLAGFYRQLGDLPAAEQELEQAVNTKPTYLQARIALGVVLLAQGKEEEAATHWGKALELDPENKTAQAYFRLTHAMEEEG